MEDERTVEIDPNELSQDVVDELVDDNVMDEEQATKKGDSVWMNEVTDKNPKKVGLVQYLKSLPIYGQNLFLSKYKIIKNKTIRFCGYVDDYTGNKIKYLKNKKTVFAEVKSVEPNKMNDSISVEFEHGRIHNFTVNFDPQSTVFSNILEYKSINNPEDLEGKKLPILRESFDKKERNGIIIPHNVSKSGKIRFKIYSIFIELREKSRISAFLDTDVDNMLVIYLFIGIISFMLYITGLNFSSENTILSIIRLVLTLPLAVWGSILAINIGYYIYLSILLIITRIMNSNYKKIKE